jgi:transcriptional regulator with GAF, ATPase, and Fis domain
MVDPHIGLAEKLRILQLETLYDLAVSLHADRPEQELVDELLQRVCAALDPAAAVAVTRDALGGARATASVGWSGDPPAGEELLAGPLWGELVASGQPLVWRDGELVGRGYGELLAVPLAGREVYLGYVAVCDKEVRGGDAGGFTVDDRRFLGSVAALAGVALEGVRQVESLEAHRERLEEENRALKDRLVDGFEGPRIVAHSRVMRQVLERVQRVAPRKVSVVVRGESGTGKELVARLLHVLSGRPGSLVAVNCGALPESLLESELFGIEEGVATGVGARRGTFQLADGGTLFLDEIGDMPPSLQVRLLRALQEGEIVRVGGERPIPVDVRLVAATHQELERLVVEKEFREDLYYRLKGVELQLPPLRERRQDIPHLLRLFSSEFCRREGLQQPVFDSDALAMLMGHDYPGNVRELQNLVEAAISLAEGRVEAELIRSLMGDQGQGTSGPEPLELAAVERRHIARVLRMAGGNKSQAAQLLGIDRRTLQRRGF